VTYRIYRNGCGFKVIDTKFAGFWRSLAGIVQYSWYLHVPIFDGSNSKSVRMLLNFVSRPLEKQPGNFCKFKLLLPLPGSWHYQSKFQNVEMDERDCDSSMHDTTIGFYCCHVISHWYRCSAQ